MQTHDLHIIKKIAYALLIIFAVFLLAEIGARCYLAVKHKKPEVFLYGRAFIDSVIQKSKSREVPGSRIPLTYVEVREKADEAFKKRHTRDLSILISKPIEIIFGDFPAHINKFGFRNGDIELTKDGGRVRIMALGGSFVAGYGVKDNETWEVLLEEKLKKLPGRYEVINAGHVGDNMDHLLISLIDKTAKFKPDYLILFSAYNNQRLVKREIVLPLFWKIPYYISKVSLLYAGLHRRISVILHKNSNNFTNKQRIKTTRTDIDNLMKRYRKRLKEIYTVCNENNIRLILGLQPEFFPRDLKNLQDLTDEKQLMKLDQKLEKRNYLHFYEFGYYMQGRFNLEMKSFAEENSILLFDGVSVFPKDKSPYFMDCIHLNPKGTSLIADSLYLFFKGVFQTQ